MMTPEVLHYLAIGLAIALASIGSGIGQGIGAFSAVESLSRQSLGNDQVFRSMIIGLAFIESGVILALVISLMMLFGTTEVITWGIALAEIGIAVMIGVSAAAISISSGYAVKSSAISISRQPIFSQKILTLMLVTQSMMEAPVVFSFVMALILKSQFSSTLSIYTGIKFLAASTCLTLGSIGPCLGQGIFASSSCAAVGLNRSAYSKLLPFSIINGAVIQTPLIFSLLLSILIVFYPISESNPISTVICFCIIAFTIGCGAFGTSTAAGFVGSKTAKQIALNLESYSILFRSNILAQAFIESSVIYALIVSLALLTKSF
ncbi:MAG: ATP synthase F0 subunit C [bacterium]